jgi:hypothetical protein
MDATDQTATLVERRAETRTEDVGRVVATASEVSGRALGVVFGAVARLRPSGRPLHPTGSVGRGVLRRRGGDVPSGVAWLDEPGEDEVLVRASRSAGLPAPLPDVFGLAVRVPTGPQAYGDLLLASSGAGPLSRFVFTPALRPGNRVLTTITPYRTDGGPVLLSADHRTDRVVELAWARGRGPWHGFAALQLGEESVGGSDAGVTFDAMRNTVAGLEVYDWVRRLREPSYRSARRSRGLPG